MNTPADTFLQEAEEILYSLEQVLLELEQAPKDAERIDAAFRSLHTLKGSGDMFGFSALAAFIHHFEDAFDQIREGRAQVTPNLIAVSLDSRDHLGALLALGPNAELTPPMSQTGDKLLKRLGMLKDADATPTPDQPAPSAQSDDTPRMHQWHIRFAPEPGALKNGFRADLLLAEVAQLGALEVSCGTDHVPPMEELDPAECYLSWDMTLTSEADRNQIEDVFIFQMDAELTITDMTPQSDQAPTQEDAPTSQDKPAQSEPVAAKSDSVRVQAHRLDDLMDQLGELVIAQARLKSIAESLDDTRLEATVEEIDALVTGLRDTTLSIRMLPLSIVFGKFRRVVRDLSTELGKPASLVTDGGDTEVDKNIIDSLTEPLVHMIRNAVDHGVENTDVRTKTGKTAAATIRLSARQSGGEVLITVADDGAGLNTTAIRRRATERGLITEDQDLSDEALHQLIFEPGFSTADSLTSVSGRGVGMDAVRRVVDDLRGTIDVKSRPGAGTEVTLRLPLTLAIIDGLLVTVDGDPFVLPLSSVEECVDLPDSENSRQEGRSILRIRDQLVPYLSLDTLFGYHTSTQPGRRVAIVNAEGQRIGLVIDDVLGQLQTVIKPLSAYHRMVEELAGATILGDGSVALILDVNALVRRTSTNSLIAA